MTDRATTTQVVLPSVFTCANCGGQFTDRHSCPSMPWGNTAPGHIFVTIPQWWRVTS